jgi:hypothetical protein
MGKSKGSGSLYRRKYKDKNVTNAGTTEDNLQPGSRVYKFNTHCFQDAGIAILIFHNIWLPKSQIKI